jgi:pimeloyl-ACP methyl ester carboxylesterase
VLDHLNVERAAVCGISRGGQIAIDFTLEYAERVWALIPVAAGLGGFEYKPTDEENARFERLETLWNARDLKALTALEEETWVVGFYRAPESVDPDLRQRVHAMIEAGYVNHSLEELVLSPLKPPAAGRLSEIRVPTLVMVGDKDTGNTVQTAHVLAEGIPGARLIVYPNVAHMVPMEVAEEFNKAVLDFLAEVRM